MVSDTNQKTTVLYILNRGTIRVPEYTMHIAAYVRVSTADTNDDLVAGALAGADIDPVALPAGFEERIRAVVRDETEQMFD